MKAKLLAALAVCLMACTDEGNTIRTLEAHGFTAIKTTGYEPFACGDSDTFSTGFSAKNHAGVYVQGVVCCGMWKSCTVRF